MRCQVLFLLTVFVLACGQPFTVGAAAPRGLQVDAACVIHLASGSEHWLSAVELALLIRTLQQSQPLPAAEPNPHWSHRIRLLTEQGELALLVADDHRLAQIVATDCRQLRLPATAVRLLDGD